MKVSVSMSDKNPEVQIAELSGEMKTTRDVLGVKIDALSEILKSNNEHLRQEIEHNRNNADSKFDGITLLLKDKADKEAVKKLEAEIELKAAKAALAELQSDFNDHLSDEKTELKERIKDYNERLDKKLDAKDWRMLTAFGIIFTLCGLILLGKAKEIIDHRPEPVAVVRNHVEGNQTVQAAPK